MSMEDKRHELLTEIADHVTSVLVEHSIAKDVAEQAGCAVADHLSQTWAGSTICIPKDYHFRISQRDQEILSKFRGNNHRNLALEYGLTENAIYKLLKRVQDRNFHRQQGRLDL